MGIILVAQGIFMALFGIFVSFNLFGRDGAAVMTAGNIGWGCGSGSNAVATRKRSWTSTAGTLSPGFYIRPLPLSSTISTTRSSSPSSEVCSGVDRALQYLLVSHLYNPLFRSEIPLSDRFCFVFLKYIVSATDFMLYSKDVKLQKLSGAFSGFTA